MALLRACRNSRSEPSLGKRGDYCLWNQAIVPALTRKATGRYFNIDFSAPVIQFAYESPVLESWNGQPGPTLEPTTTVISSASFASLLVSPGNRFRAHTFQHEAETRTVPADRPFAVSNFIIDNDPAVLSYLSGEGINIAGRVCLH